MIEHMIVSDPDLMDQVRRIYNGERHDDWSFQYVACELFDEWKWGLIKLLVIRDEATDKLWGLLVREQASGSGMEWTSLEDDGEYAFESVVSVPRTEYVLARLSKW